jgi:predicted RecA/RadA family phage recombinase
MSSARYLTTAVIYGAVLAGRQLAWVAGRLPARRRVAVGLAVAALAVAFAVTPLAALHAPDASDAGRDLAPWLAANGLRSGYSSYWTASIVTVESGGSIAVRPVTAVDGRLRGYVYYSTRRWFTDAARPGRWFVLYDPAHPTWGVDERSAEATFGPPVATVEHGPYRILIWDHDLSSQLGPPYRDPERALTGSPGAGHTVGRLAA